MTNTKCDPCCSPSEYARTIDMYRTSVLSLLCTLIAAVESGGSVPAIEAAYATLVTKTYTFFTAVYQTIGLITAAPAREIVVHNFTDANLVYSFDGVNDVGVLPAQSTRTIDFWGNGMIESSDIQVKYLSTPTSGTVYFEAKVGAA